MMEKTFGLMRTIGTKSLRTSRSLARQPELLGDVKVKEERQVILKFSDCTECPFHYETDGICGEARWCKHPSKKKVKQICDKDYDLAFPRWCPIPSEKKQDTLTCVVCKKTDLQSFQVGPHGPICMECFGKGLGVPLRGKGNS